MKIENTVVESNEKKNTGKVTRHVSFAPTLQNDNNRSSISELTENDEDTDSESHSDSDSDLEDLEEVRNIMKVIIYSQMIININMTVYISI